MWVPVKVSDSSKSTSKNLLRVLGKPDREEGKGLWDFRQSPSLRLIPPGALEYKLPLRGCLFHSKGARLSLFCSTQSLVLREMCWFSPSVMSNSCNPMDCMYVAHQVPLSMGFSRQDYWSGLPFPSPGDLPNPGTKPGFSALQADSLQLSYPAKPYSGKGGRYKPPDFQAHHSSTPTGEEATPKSAPQRKGVNHPAHHPWKSQRSQVSIWRSSRRARLGVGGRQMTPLGTSEPQPGPSWRRGDVCIGNRGWCFDSILVQTF